jgi:glycosyltransferase involved in cell wall biosynthesis
MSRAISLFFPMYNEEANVERSVLAAVEALSKVAGDFEVIVVDDGSRDRTAAVAERLRAAEPRVRLVRHPANQGYGAAVRSGIAAARFPLVFFTDGDNQFDLRELPRVVEAIEGADVVAGYRQVRRDPWHRRLNAALFNGVVRRLFAVPVRDVNCAFKLFRREVLEGLALTSRGALINVEILTRARRRGARVREVGVTHYPRLAGSQTGARPKVVLRAFVELVRLWRELK